MIEYKMQGVGAVWKQVPWQEMKKGMRCRVAIKTGQLHSDLHVGDSGKLLGKANAYSVQVEFDRRFGGHGCGGLGRQGYCWNCLPELLEVQVTGEVLQEVRSR
jgi:hypothetical protein